MVENYEVLSCKTHEGAGELEVSINISGVTLNITYFLFDDLDDWAYTHGFDENDEKRTDLLPEKDILSILDNPCVKIHKDRLEEYKEKHRNL